MFVRGVLARKALEFAEGGSLSAEELGKVLGRSREGIDHVGRAGRVIAWRDTQGKWCYPAWQLTAHQKLLSGLFECLNALNTRSHWEPMIFFLSPRDSLEGERPLDLLRIGRIDEAVAAAERHGGHILKMLAPAVTRDLVRPMSAAPPASSAV